MKCTPRWMFLAVFMLSVALVASTAMAQPGGRGRGPGGGGPGGFFGMRGGGGAVGMLQSELVRTKLGVDTSATEKLQEIRSEQEEARREAFRSMGDFRDLSEDERRQRFEEMRKKAEEQAKEIEAKVAGIIGQEAFGKLKGFELQMLGVAAMARPEVAKALGLTEEQTEKIEALFQENREKMMSMFQDFRNMSDADREAAREKMTAARQSLQKDVMGVLTADQKKKLGEMMGTPLSEEEMATIREQMRGDRGRGGFRGRGGRDGRGGEGRGGRPGGGERRQRPS